MTDLLKLPFLPVIIEIKPALVFYNLSGWNAFFYCDLNCDFSRCLCI